ncbi:hypothetical protein ABAC460_17830 [Asticcacaulis sp. AC460]|nr:hypothetical protein ABAC460_17830 [Asticcacaulis sp. AC460]
MRSEVSKRRLLVLGEWQQSALSPDDVPLPDKLKVQVEIYWTMDIQH